MRKNIRKKGRLAQKVMKVLVITDVLWRNDNGVGNSYSNIFCGMKNISVANICCAAGKSQNEISEKCFQISEGMIFANLKHRSTTVGKTENKDSSGIETVNPENKLVTALKRSRLQVLFWARDLIWKTGRWKSKELKAFLDEYKPDVIFAQLQDKIYLNNVIMFVRDYTKKPLFIYAWDDVYSMKQFFLSPLFWIDRIIRRRSIRKLIGKSKLLYTISKEQKEEYAKSLKIKTDLLYKGNRFDKQPEYKGDNKFLKLVYTGNLYSGRYKSILELCKILKEENSKGKKAELYIYSATPLSKPQKKKIDIDGTSHFMGKVSEKEVKKLQNDADILVHIEPISLKGSLLCRLSFSTKLVDYFYSGKCIFAFGSERCSAIKYLKRNDAAVTAVSYSEMKLMLHKLLNNGNMLKEYSDKAWECGRKNHDIDTIQKRIYREFEEAVNESSSN